MTIQFTCPVCDEELKLSESYAGKKIRCPSCQAVVTVPSGFAPPPPAEPQWSPPAPSKPTPPTPPKLPTYIQKPAPPPPAFDEYHAPEPSAPYSAGSRSVQPAPGTTWSGEFRKYPALQIVVVFLMIAAAITGLFAVYQMVDGLVTLVDVDNRDIFKSLEKREAFFRIIAGFAELIMSVLLLAIAECIRVILHIEQNTRHACNFLRDRLNDD